jgi:hypothetical protein
MIVGAVGLPVTIFVIYERNLNPKYGRDRKAIEGRYDTLLEGVNENNYKMAIRTVIYPMLRDLACATIITTLHNHSFSALFLMYTLIMYLGFLLGGRRYEEGNLVVILDHFIVLYLTYLLLLLSDFVQDARHFQSVSNQFLYATLFLIGFNLAILVIEILNKIRKLCKRFFLHRKLRK